MQYVVCGNTLRLQNKEYDYGVLSIYTTTSLRLTFIIEDFSWRKTEISHADITPKLIFNIAPTRYLYYSNGLSVAENTSYSSFRRARS